MKKLRLLCFISIIPLLMSATSVSNFYSNITGRSYSNEIEQVIRNDIYSMSGTSNGDTGFNVAMDVDVDYEFFKMGHNAIYTSWPNVYSLIYRIHVDVKQTYQYKTGWWIFGNTNTVMPILSEISADLSISGLSNTSIIYSGPFIERNRSYNVREDSIFFDTTGGLISSYNGSYYFPVVSYFSPSSTNYNDDLFYIRKNTSFYGNTFELSSVAYYDTYLLKNYTDTDVYIFGGVSFVSDSLPSNIELSYNVKCGATKNNEAKMRYLTIGSTSNQLSDTDIRNLITDGYSGQIIEREYDNIVTVSNSIDIF